MENEVLTDRELAIRLLADALGVTRPMAEAHFDAQRQRFPAPLVPRTLGAGEMLAEADLSEFPAIKSAVAISAEDLEPTTLDEPEAAPPNVSPETTPEATDPPAEEPHAEEQLSDPAS